MGLSMVVARLRVLNSIANNGSTTHCPGSTEYHAAILCILHNQNFQFSRFFYYTKPTEEFSVHCVHEIITRPRIGRFTCGEAALSVRRLLCGVRTLVYEVAVAGDTQIGL